MQVTLDQRLVLGSPGTGKTTRLLGIVEEELAQGTFPTRIAYVSFTKKAVEEATDRAKQRFGFSTGDLPFFRTLHSLCFQLLGLRRSDVISMADYQQLGEELGYVFGEYEHNPEDGYPTSGNEGDRLLFVLQLARNRCVTLEEQWQELNDPDIDLYALKRIQAALDSFKKEQGRLDFSDMLERVLEERRCLDLDAVVIDEAQDLSNLQWRVCQQVFSKTKRGYIGGDDDQAIYKWGGADVDTFLSLTGEKEVLALSYRLPKSVYSIASRVIESVGHRFQKTWSPKEEEGNVHRVPDLSMMDFEGQGSWLILARNGYLLTEAEAMLRKAGVPYLSRKGTPAVDPNHFLAIKAWEKLRKGEPQKGSQVRRVYDLLQPGVGVMRGAKGALQLVEDREYSIDTLRNQHGLLASGIWHDVLEGIPLNTREYYLAILRAGRKLHAVPEVKLGTIHSSKGGEADNVTVLLDMSQRTHQSYQRFPDDEKRVYYVAMTRAKHSLYLVDAKSPQCFEC